MIEIPATVAWLAAVMANVAVDEQRWSERWLDWFRAYAGYWFIGTLAVLFLVGGVKQTRQLGRLHKPALYLTEIAVSEAPRIPRRIFTADNDTRRITGEHVEVISGLVVNAFVANAPKGFAPEAAVRNAVLTVRFYAEGRDRPVWESAEGYWGDNGAGFAANSTIDDLRRRDLPANGETHRIDLALKFDGSNHLTPWCAPYMMDATRDFPKLGPGSYTAEFIITGEGLDAPFARRFAVVNPDGPGSPAVHSLGSD